MTAQPEAATAPQHLLSLPSADDLDVARILGLPAVPAGDEAIDEAYRELSKKGQVLYVRGVAVAADNLVPNAPVDIPDWARGHLRLPAAQSQRSGPLIMSPLQAAICRLWATKRRVTFLKPPRFGSTLIMVVGLTYHAGHLGVDVLFYERTEGDCQDFHDKKLYPILTESPALAHLIRADSRSGIQDAWMDRILTTGASIQLRGVSTNGSMRGIKGLFIGVDEASSAEYQAGTKGEKGEGSKLSLIIKRAQEFFDPCVYVGGTPTVVGACITSEEYEKGDQCLFMMRSSCCPDVAQEFWDDIQHVEGRHVRLGKGMRYTCDETTGRIADVWYECVGCGGAIEETEKVAMMETGVLVPQNAERAEPDHASVWGWAAYSTDPQSTWMHIAREHQAQLKDPELRQPFMNLVRARPWKPDGPGIIDAHALAERCEAYPPGHMPPGVKWVLVGMDTQEGGRNGKPRHELVFVGYGENEESWILDRVVIEGIPGVDRDGNPVMEDLEPFSPDAARLVWAALDREWITADGEVLTPEMVAVDVGYDMNRALAFCHNRQSKRRKVVAVKGRREAHGSRMPVITKRPSVSKSGFEFQPVGTQSAKDTIYRRFGYAVGQPESIHAPEHLRHDAIWDQIAAESLHNDDKGRTWWDVTKPGTPNEAIDCLVYAYAALCLRKAKSRRIREGVAIRLERPMTANADNVPASGARPAAVDPVTLHGPRGEQDGPRDVPRPEPSPAMAPPPLSGVRRITRDRPRGGSPAAIEAPARAAGRFNVIHAGRG